jgi:integrase/recombinase XerD
MGSVLEKKKPRGDAGPYEVVPTTAGHPAFRVVGPDGAPHPEAEAFLVHLSRSGYSPYTLRSYSTGLAHFLGWLHGMGEPVASVTRGSIGEYVDQFALEPKGGACRTDGGRANPATREPDPSMARKPSTINHRLSVLHSFFEYLLRDRPEEATRTSANPVPGYRSPMEGSHGMPGRDAPRHGRRAEFRRRQAEDLPKGIDPVLAEKIIAAATSRRDKAILTLMWRTGQRVGDWSAFAGRHGVLGMVLSDLDEAAGLVTVRLKGARDEHRVPVTDDFWPLYRAYLERERGDGGSTEAAWVGLRRGRGRPLTYSAFESSLRYAAKKVGANVNAHMFRHALAQAVVDGSGIKTAQEILGHRHVGTTARAYARVDEAAMVEAVAAAARPLGSPSPAPGVLRPKPGPGYAFAYDPGTADELERLVEHNGLGLSRSVPEQGDGT